MPISLLHVQHFSSGILNSKIKTKQRAVATEHCAEEKKQKNEQKKTKRTREFAQMKQKHEFLQQKWDDEQT